MVMEKNSGIVKETFVIPYITGDGIGKEITPVMIKVVNTVVDIAYSGKKRVDWQQIKAGREAFLSSGEYLPSQTLEAIRKRGVAIKGPLETPVGEGIRSLNVALRQELDLYVCQRPVKWYRGVSAPIKNPENVNMVIFRENTEDVYSGIEWEADSQDAAKFGDFIRNQMGVNKVRFPLSSAYGVKPVSREGSQRLIRAAIEYALENNLPNVTLVHKGNIMKYTEGGFRKWGYELASREYSNELSTGKLVVNDIIADAFFQNALLYPKRYDVVATLNLNGDYISDMLAATVGGVGIAPGANINYEKGYAVFEATHGTAPDIAGKNIANPLSIILSAEMMLRYLGMERAADILDKSVELTLSANYATFDIAQFMKDGKVLSTTQFGEQLIKNLVI